MNWIVLTAILCLFGFVKEMRPSEAFLTMYLTGPWKNLTVEQVDNEVYPWWTYSYLIWLVPIFLLTDFLRYKPVLVLDGLAYIATWALLLWAQGVPAMKCMQVTYGLVTAADVAYYSYLYVEVPKLHYQRVTSFTRAAALTGKFVSYVLAQVLYSCKLLDLYGLHVFSFVAVCIAFTITLFLPWPKHSEIFHRYRLGSQKQALSRSGQFSYSTFQDDESQDHPSLNSDGSVPSLGRENPYEDTYNKLDDINAPDSKGTCKDGFIFIWKEVKSIYNSRLVIVWSVWWAFASCGNFQVLNYVQNLWSVVSSEDHSSNKTDVYNGAVEAASTLGGSISVLIVGFLPIDWSKSAELFMAAVCLGNMAFLIIMAHTNNIWVAYVMYVLFRISYVTVITIASAQIAKHLAKQRYGLVFGCNTFVALGIETILTIIVVDKAGLDVNVFIQFTVYGGYFGVVGLLFLIVSIYRCFKPTTNEQLDVRIYQEVDVHSGNSG